MERWFDLPKSQRDELVARVVGGRDPATRVDLAREARRTSGAELYQGVYESIREGESFRPTDTMPLDISVLVNHLRIDIADSSPVRWTDSAERLISDVGVIEAAQRLGGLPIALPRGIVTALGELPPVERRRSLRTIRRVWLSSPVGVIHLAQLWEHLPQVNRHAAKVRRRLARVLCSESRRPTFRAWLTTLRWVDEQFAFNESARLLPRPVHLALVWSHADRVFRILLSRGLSPEWIESAFNRHEYAAAAELVFPRTAYSEDVAAPQRLGAEIFALVALSVICTDSAMEAAVQTMLGKSVEGMSNRGRIALVQTMLSDTRQATNILGSWLENDRRWLSLFSEVVRKDFTFEAIDAAVEEACAGIVGQKDEQRCWAQLGAILGDLPPSEFTQLAVENVLLSADLVDYIHRDPSLAAVVIGVMASQARHLTGEVRTRIEEQLLAAAAVVADAGVEIEKREAISRAILAGLVGCTWREPEGEARASALAMLFERLDSSPVFVGNGSFILGLCDALPVSQARHFWRLRDLLRLKSRW